MSKYAFSITQILLSFSLGLFGNKLAEIINISPTIVIIGTCLLIGVSIFLESSQYQKNPNTTQTTLNSPQVRFSFKLNRIITVFPIGMILGALLALFSFIFFPYPEFPKLSVRLFSGYETPGYGPFIYECISYAGAIVLIYVIASRKQDPAITYAFSVGYAWGMSAAFLTLDPYLNSAEWTYIVWLVTMIITAILIVQIRLAINTLIDSLFKERN